MTITATISGGADASNPVLLYFYATGDGADAAADDLAFEVISNFNGDPEYTDSSALTGTINQAENAITADTSKDAYSGVASGGAYADSTGEIEIEY